MNCLYRRHLLAALICLSATLVACGGESGAGGTPVNSESLPIMGDGTGRFSFEAFEAQSSAAQFISQANLQGDRGFRFRSDQVIGGQTKSIYIRDADAIATYDLKSILPGSTVADFLSQANAQGALGYRYRGDRFFDGAFVSLYIKDESKSSTFDFEAQPSVASAADFLTQANGRGALGYRYFGQISFASGIQNIYVRDASSTATFDYKTEPKESTAAGFVTQANAQGANSYRFRGHQIFGPETVTIYLNESTAGSFSYTQLAPVASPTEYIAQANEQGENQLLHLGDQVFGATSAVSIYADLSACTCSTLGLADPFFD